MSREKQMLGPYELLHTLGKGMSGKVKLAVDTRTGETVAAKILLRSKMSSRGRDQLNREITVMKNLSHSSVIQLKDFYTDANYTKKNGQKVPVAVLFLELAGSGELLDFILYTGALPEDVVRTYFTQMLSALEACHNRGIAHRDLKPENVLLDYQYQIKLADFGLASVAEGGMSMCRTECGTRSYMAPEVMQHRPEGYQGSKSDIWSLGVVLFIMIAGNPPFALANSSDWWFNAVSNGRYDRFWAAHLRACPNFPLAAQDLLNQMFTVNPSQRPSIPQLMEHPWVRGGGLLTPEEMCERLQGRKAEVDKQKEVERLATRKKKGSAGTGATSATSSFDPFATDTCRGVASTVDCTAPSLPPAGTRGMLQPLYYDCGATAVLLAKLAEAVAGCAVGGPPDGVEVGETEAELPVVTVKEKAAKVKAVYPARGLEVTIQLYATEERDSHVIHVLRRRGDPFETRTLRAQLGQALGLADAFADVAGGTAEERESPTGSADRIAASVEEIDVF
ncbi:unnamed protein product [Chrysoparadoxa australica]